MAVPGRAPERQVEDTNARDNDNMLQPQWIVHGGSSD